VHTNPNFSTVGTIQVLNEPLSWQPSITASMISQYYPQAYKAIRDAESACSVAPVNRVHIQFMNSNWGR
jgi:glucan endo-1,6-beta-glucosidase